MKINFSSLATKWNTLPFAMAKYLPGSMLSRAGALLFVLDLMAARHLLKTGTAPWDLLLHASLTLGLTMLGFEVVKRWIFPAKSRWNAWISASILFLILHPGMTHADLILSAVCAGACAGASVALTFLTARKGKVWVNPVVLALLLVTLGTQLLGSSTPFISWWGTGFGQHGQTWIWTSLWAVLVLTEWRKWSSFLGFVLVMLTLKTDAFLANSVLFFLAAVMLVEPKTSPFKPKEQWIYGLFAGLVFVGLGNLGVTASNLWAITLANLAFTTGLLSKVMDLTSRPFRSNKP